MKSMVKNSPKKKVGRPKRKYDLRMILKMAGCGLTDKQMCSILKVAESTFNLWKKDPIFSESLNAEKLKYDQQVVDSLRQRALGYTHKEILCFQYRGKIITKEVLKHYPPDSTSAIFWLKNRQPGAWKDKTEIDHGITEEAYEKYQALTVDQIHERLNALTGNRIANLN